MYNLIQVSVQMLPISKACLTCIKEDPPPVGDLYPLTLPPFPLKWLSPPCNLHTLYVYVHMYVFAYYCLPPTGSKLHEGNKFVSFVKGYLPNQASQVVQWETICLPMQEAQET